MVAKYGRDTVEELQICAEQKLKWTCEQLAEKKIQLMEMARKQEERLK